MSKILIIRLSAIGDVAMTIPVIYSAAEANPCDSFTVLTQNFLMPLFPNRPANINITGINTKGAEKSFIGLLRYTFSLRKYKFDKVLDLHDVLRSRTIDFVFTLWGKKIIKIDKGRSDRKRLVRRPPKSISPLMLVTERYSEVFRKAGFVFENTFISLFEKKSSGDASVFGEKKGKWIGIAPFAKHEGKMYPLDKMEKVVAKLSENKDYILFLFGSRGNEAAKLNEWSEKYPNVRNVAGRYSLDMELVLISKLDVLVSMDSANMHFASLVGTPVISVWGATHPYAGFYGYGQKPENAIQMDLECRPCSIYGNKPCYRGDFACMNEISPEQVSIKIMNFLNIV
jgi:ADP-heptose:LPS heptosyltransferase